MAGELSIVTIITGAISGYIGAVLSQDRARWYETRNLANSLSAEIINLNVRIQMLGLYLDKFYQDRAYPSDSNLIEREKVEVPMIHRFTANDMAVYNGNTSKIGLLKIDDAQSIVWFYIGIRNIVSQIDHLNKLSNGEYKNINYTNIDDYDISFVASNLSLHCKAVNKYGSDIIKGINVYHDNWAKYTAKAFARNQRNNYNKFLVIMKKIRETA